MKKNMIVPLDKDKHIRIYPKTLLTCSLKKTPNTPNPSKSFLSMPFPEDFF